MNERIVDLTAADLAALESQRAWVISHYATDAAQKYASVEGKLNVLDVILSSGWVEATETVKLQCLGVAFGDALAQEFSGRWVYVEEKDATDFAVELGGSILIFPMAPIPKRLGRGEKVDVKTLFADVCNRVRQSDEAASAR